MGSSYIYVHGTTTGTHNTGIFFVGTTHQIAPVGGSPNYHHHATLDYLVPALMVGDFKDITAVEGSTVNRMPGIFRPYSSTASVSVATVYGGNTIGSLHKYHNYIDDHRGDQLNTGANADRSAGVYVGIYRMLNFSHHAHGSPQ